MRFVDEEDPEYDFTDDEYLCWRARRGLISGVEYKIVRMKHALAIMVSAFPLHIHPS